MTRLGDFSKFLLRNFRIKEAQTFSDHFGYFENHRFWSNCCTVHFLEIFGLRFIPTSDHTGLSRFLSRHSLSLSLILPSPTCPKPHQDHFFVSRLACRPCRRRRGGGSEKTFHNAWTNVVGQDCSPLLESNRTKRCKTVFTIINTSFRRLISLY